MDIWEILGMEETEDETAIREAYLTKLPLYHPEDDPEGFKRLREALEEALKRARVLQKQKQEEMSGAFEGGSIMDSGEIQNFLKQAAELYRDYARRINPKEWEKLMALSVCQDLESQKEAGWALLSYIMDHVHMPHCCYQMFNQTFGWLDDEEELYQHFPEDFVGYVADRIRNEDIHLRYDRFAIREGFDYDDFCEKFYGLRRALRDKNQEAAEAAIAALDAMDMDHPDLTIQKIRHESLQHGHEQQAWEMAKELFSRDRENPLCRYWYVNTALNYENSQITSEEIDELLHSLLDNDPDSVIYLQLLATHLEQLEENAQALGVYLKIRGLLEDRNDYLEEQIASVAEKLSYEQEKDPELDDWWKMAQICWMGHRYGRVRELLEKEEPEEKRELSWLFMMAGSCHELGDFESAVKYRQKYWDMTDPDDRPLNLYLDLAKEYKEIGEISRAMEIYSQAQECFPREPEVAHQVARLLFDEERADEALEQCNKALSMAFHQEAFYLRLRILLDEKRYEEVRDDAEKVISQGFRSAQVLFDYAIALRNLGNYEEAEKVLKELLERSGEVGILCQEYAYLCADQERYAEALEWIEKALAERDTSVRQMMKADYLKELKRFDEQVEVYQGMIRGGVDYDYVYNYLGRALEALRKYGEAEQNYRKAVEIDPSYGAAWDNLGDVLQNQGKWEEAVYAYEQGWKAGNRQAVRDLCRLLKRMHENEKAEEYLKKGLIQFPDDGSLLWIYALLLERKKRFDEAIRCLGRYMEVKPSATVSAYREIASCWEDAKEFEKAEEYYQKAIDYDPKDAKSWRMFGKYFANKRKMQERALPYLEKSVQLDENSTYGWLKLGEVYEELGQQEKAMECYEKSLKCCEAEVKDDPYHCCNYEGMADALVHLGRLDEAEAMAHRALSLQNEIFYCSSLHCYEGLEDLSKVEEKRGNLEKALEWMKKAGSMATTDYYPNEIARLEKAVSESRGKI